MSVTQRLEYSWLATILMGHLLIALLYSASNPLGEAPDEADHWAYVVYLANERSLPVGPQVTQSKHPPFYHATAALIASLAEPTNDFLRSNPDVNVAPHPGWSPNFFVHGPEEQWPGSGAVLAFYLARFWSVLLSTCTVAAAYGLARTAFPQMRHLALATAAVLAFIPEFLFIGASINNDNMAALFGTLALWGAFAHLYGGGAYRSGWWTPLALGLGLLSKTSTLVLWPIVGLAIIVGAANSTTSTETDRSGGIVRTGIVQLISSWRTWLRTCLLVFVPALLLASPWLIRNWQLYGDPLGMALVRQTIDLRTSPWGWAGTNWLIQGWFRSFWGKFGGAGQIPMPSLIYRSLLVLVLCSMAGVFRLGIRTKDNRIRLSLLFLVAAIVATVIGIWRYSLIALGTDQGRLLYPALVAFVLLFVAGLLTWVPPRYQHTGGLGLGLIFLALGLYAYFGVMRPAFAPPRVVPIEEWPSLASPDPIQWSELTLIGWQLGEASTLYWHAQEEPTEDWRVVLRVLAVDGTLVWEWRRSPAAGRWRTDRWPADVLVRDHYQIRWPAWAGPGQYHVEVGLQAFGQDLATPRAVGEGTSQPEKPFVYLGEISR